MCIAIYKPAGVKMPELKTFENCWESNSDGAGYAVRKDGQCHIHKGIMDWKEFEKAYDTRLCKLRDYDVLLHFRIHTHGGVNKENTHPFPITTNVKQLGKTYTVCPRCLIHNGVLPITPRKNSISDTAEMALRIAESGLTSDKVEALIGELLGTNKIALMNGVRVYLMGDWIQDNGVYYSNKTYSYSIYDGSWNKEWWKNYGYNTYDEYKRSWGDDYDNDWYAGYSNSKWNKSTQTNTNAGFSVTTSPNGRSGYTKDEERFIDEYTEDDEEFLAYVMASEPEWETYTDAQKCEIYNAYYGAYYDLEESGQMFDKMLTESDLDKFYNSNEGILFKQFVDAHYPNMWKMMTYAAKSKAWDEFKATCKLTINSTAAKK